MKQLRWSRPPLMLRFVLGVLIERYMFISISRYGLDWLMRPAVAVLLAAALLMLLVPFRQQIRRFGGPRGIARNIGAPSLRGADLFYLAVILLMGAMVIETLQWTWGARVGPVAVGTLGLVFAVTSFASAIFSRTIRENRAAELGEAEGLDMDNFLSFGDLGQRTVTLRAVIFFGYIVLFMAMMATIGLIPTVPLFVIIYMRAEGRECWPLALAQAVVLTLIVYVVQPEQDGQTAAAPVA